MTPTEGRRELTDPHPGRKVTRWMPDVAVVTIYRYTAIRPNGRTCGHDHQTAEAAARCHRQICRREAPDA